MTGNGEVAVFVDGPNMLRDEFDLDLAALRERVASHGRIRVAKVFLDQYASDKLIEATYAEGFEPVMGLGDETPKESDVDVLMAVHAMEVIAADTVDTVVLVTRDADFIPIIQRAKRASQRTVVIAFEEGCSAALTDAADAAEFLPVSQ